MSIEIRNSWGEVQLAPGSLEKHHGPSWAACLGVEAVGKSFCPLEGHQGLVDAVAITADGRRVVSASEDKTLKVWHLETGGKSVRSKAIKASWMRWRSRRTAGGWSRAHGTRR